MALLVSFSVKKGNEGIGVWLHFGYSLNEEAATSFLSRVILMPYRFDSGLRQIIICFNSFLRIEAFFLLQGILIRNVKILRENSICYISDTYVTAKIL